MEKEIIAQSEVEKAPDGTVWVRPCASVRVWGAIGMLAGVLLCAVTGYFYFRGSPSPFYPPASGLVSAVLCFVALDLFVIGAWFCFGWWEWQATPGMLKREEGRFGFRRTWRFTNASLVFRLVPGSKAYYWHLSVEAPGAGRVIRRVPAVDRETWAGSQVATLARILADATRFPIRDERGKAHYWRTEPVPGQAPGSLVQIRHLHTGAVMEQVPGGTLAGAHLAEAILEGADLQGADLTGANLAGAHLEGASLKETKLANAKLTGALLTAAELSGADLTGADLTGVKLIGATYDVRTRWPAGFDPRQHGAVLAE